MNKIIVVCLLVTLNLFTLKAQFIQCDKASLTIDKNETVSVILTDNEAINEQIIKVIESSWTACKYEYTTIDAIATTGKIGKYHMLAIRVASADYSSGYSTNYAYYKFGESNKELSKAIEKYQKNPNEQIIINALGSRLISAYMDPSNIDNNFVHFTSGHETNPSSGQMNLGQPAMIIDKNGISIPKRGKTVPSNELLKAKEYVNFIGIAIKNLNWMLEKNALKFAEVNKAYQDFGTATIMYNTNSCNLKNMTLLVSSDYTVIGNKLDPTKKNFILSEFKQFYKYKTEIVDSDKIAEYTVSDTTGKYAVMLQGVWERTPVCLIYRLKDGAVMFGSKVAMGMFPGYTKATYQSFEKVCQ